MNVKVGIMRVNKENTGTCFVKERIGGATGPFLASTFFNDFQFQKIKFNLFDEAVLVKPYLRVALKLLNVRIKPDRNTKIKFRADGF